jgi:hypothetical protein
MMEEKFLLQDRKIISLDLHPAAFHEIGSFRDGLIWKFG